MSQPDSRSPLSMGMAWAGRISGLGLEFALPAILGGYLDRRLGTAPAGILVGMVVGFAVGMFHILRIARDAPK